MPFIKNYKENESGNISVMFALGLTVLLTSVAIAVDHSGMISLRTQLQNQVDNAALGAAVQLANNQENPNFNLANAAEDILIANGYDLSYYKPSVTNRDGLITVSAKAEHQSLLGAFNKSATNDIYAESSVHANGGQTLEIALLLDSTASMGFHGKVGALKVAGSNFIDVIEDSGMGTKVAIVPFARYVNIGEENLNATWLDVPEEYDTVRTWQQAVRTGEKVCTTEERTLIKDGQPYTYDAEICTGQTTTYETQSRVIESRWEGCVGVRSSNLHIADGSYELERVPGLLNIHPYEQPEYDHDVKSPCPTPITPLTNDYAHLKSEIVKVSPTDNTYIPLGLSWAYRVLSPEVPFTGATADTQKVIVLMSDGHNTVEIDNSLQSQNEHTAPPYLRHLDDGEAAPQADADTAAMCEQMKSEGMEIFTVAFRMPDLAKHNALISCASSDDHYYNADSNEKLNISFEHIANRLQSELRITN